MSSELDELRRELEEVKRLREEEQRRREEEQRYYEQRTGKTILAEFLNACHVHLYQGLTVQDESQSTRGTPANADRKLRPDRILPWEDFGAHQTPVWDAVMESDFMSERHFTSLHTLEEDGEQLHRRKLSSELDVRYFVQFAIDDRVTSIIERLSQHAVLYYMGWVPIVHMMVLTFGGRPLNHLRTLPDATTAIDGLRAIHGLGVLHRDVARRNMLWDSKEQKVIWHDFGQSRIHRRIPLTEKSAYHRTISAADKNKGGGHRQEFSREILKALSVLKPRA